MVGLAGRRCASGQTVTAQVLLRLSCSLLGRSSQALGISRTFLPPLGKRAWYVLRYLLPEEEGNFHLEGVRVRSIVS